MYSRIKTFVLYLALGCAVLATPAVAQQVMYCDSQALPFGDFALSVPIYDVLNYPLIDADVVLNVTYSGLFEGENTDLVEACNYLFGMTLSLDSAHFDGTVFDASDSIELTGWLGEVGGVDPSTVSIPISGTLIDDLVISWDELLYFYLGLTLTFDMGSFGGVAEMSGDADFSWSFDLAAEVCATYSYDAAVPVDSATFGAVKALYR